MIHDFSLSRVTSHETEYYFTLPKKQYIISLSLILIESHVFSTFKHVRNDLFMHSEKEHVFHSTFLNSDPFLSISQARSTV